MAGCAQRRPLLPVEMISRAELVGYPGVRGWWEHSAAIESSLRQAMTADNGTATAGPGGCDILCLSGGGPGGAFGAGLLCGWTECGDRPRFRLVTGVSTGGLIAPFAFLGPEYDDVLRRFCTSISTRDILRRRPLVAVALGAESLADSSPLAGLIEECMDDRVVAAVAREHACGRRLLVGTTHLAAGRLVVWDMGAIASSPRPDAPAMFRKVMLASASIPIALPPQHFEVQADGRTFDELHVDGGVVAEMFLYGVSLNAQGFWGEGPALVPCRPRLYVVRNGYLRTPARVTPPGLWSLGERAVGGFLDGKATGDVYHIHALAHRDGLDFNLAYVPDRFVVDMKEPFDPRAMSRLFIFGHDQARNGYPWQKLPPGLAPLDAGGDLLAKN